MHLMRCTAWFDMTVLDGRHLKSLAMNLHIGAHCMLMVF